MTKLIAILAMSAVVAGGASYGLYEYTDVFGHRCNHEDGVVVHGGCCGGPTDCCSPEDDASMTAAVAVAGPVGVIPPTTPVSTVASCCEAKATHAACCEGIATPGHENHGLTAVVGTAATAGK